MKIFLLFALALFLCSSFSRAQIITTIAGDGTSGYTGDGGLANTAKLYAPNNIVIDRNNVIYFIDQNRHCIRKIDNSDVITTIAGIDTTGFRGDNGPATLAEFNTLFGIAIDDSSNIYVTDDLNNRIRKINTSGIITTIAGTGINGFAGDGGSATLAELSFPHGVALDRKGNLFFCDEGNSCIRKIDASGIITTVAGNNTFGYNGDNIPATLAELNIAIDVTVDFAGNLYVSDLGNSRLRKIDTSGIITTVAGNGIHGYSGDGGPAVSAELNNPWSSVVDKYGAIYIVDNENYRIRKVGADGIITTFVGTGTLGYSGDNGLSGSAEISYDINLALDSCGYLYITDDLNNRLRKVTAPYCNAEFIPIDTLHHAIAIYPNPNDGNFILTTSDASHAKVIVTDMLGRIAKEWLMNGIHSGNVELSVPSGLYIITVSTEKGTYTNRLDIIR